MTDPDYRLEVLRAAGHTDAADLLAKLPAPTADQHHEPPPPPAPPAENPPDGPNFASTFDRLKRGYENAPTTPPGEDA
jgi:hypothetical protein